MRDDLKPILARNVRPGMRIIINACFSINPSLEEMKKRSVPMTIQVSHVKSYATSVLIEAMSCKLFEIPSGANVGKLIPNYNDTDLLKPQAKQTPEFFNHVSID